MTEPKPLPQQYVDARKHYTIASIIDAVESRDLAVITDAARLYPALVVGLLAEPVLLMRSLWGHRKAHRAEYALKGLFYLKRKTAVEKMLGEGDARSATPEEVGEALGLDAASDEARRLLEKLVSDE